MFGNVEDLRADFEEAAAAMEAFWRAQSDRLSGKKVKALAELKSKPRLADENRLPEWKYHILKLKIQQLIEATSAGEVDEILAKVSYHMSRFRIPVHSRFWLLEEECMFWMKASLEAPLSHEGHERYMEVFAAMCEKYGWENPLGESA